MYMVISISGFFAFIGCLVWLVVSIITKGKKKKSLIGIAITLILFVGGGIAAGFQTQQIAVKPESQITSSNSIIIRDMKPNEITDNSSSRQSEKYKTKK